MPTKVESASGTTAEDEKTLLKNRLVRFYKRYCPEKLDTIDEMVKKYLGAESKLFAALSKKYGPEPVDEDLFEIDDEILKAQVFKPREATWTARLKNRVFAMLTLPGRRMVLGGGSTGCLEIVNPITGHAEKTIQAHTDSILSICLGVQGIFTGSADSTIRLWNLKNFEVERVYEGHDGMIISIAMCQAAGTTGLFSGSDDLKVFQWNIDNGQYVQTYDCFEAPINALEATSSHLFAGTADGRITMIEILKKKVVKEIDGHINGVWSFCSDPEGVLFSGGGDGLIKIWPDLSEDDNCACVLTGHTGTIRSLMFYEDTLFSCGSDASVCIWDFDPQANQCVVKQVLRMMTPQGTQCEKPILAMGLANGELVAAGFDKVVNRWDVSDILQVEMEMLPLPDLDQFQDDEFEQKLAAMHPRDRHRHFAMMDIGQAVKRYTELPLNYVIESLNYKVESSWLMNELVIFIPFLIMFLFFFLSDYSAKDLYYMNLAAVRMTDSQALYGFKSTRSFMEVTDYNWWFQWATVVLIPGIWQGKSTTQWHEVQRFMGQNQFIGALRFRTKRVLNGTCATNTEVLPEDLWYGMYNPSKTAPLVSDQGDYNGCYDQFNFNSGEETTPFACALGYNCLHTPSQLSDPTTFDFPSGQFEYNASKGTRYRGLKFYSTGGYSIDIPLVKSEAQAIQMLRTAMVNGFVDTVATRFLSAEYFSYNPQLNFFVAHKMVVEVFPGGSLYSSVQHKPFKIFSYSSQTAKVVYDCFFFIFVLYWFAHYFIEMSSHKKMYGERLSYIFNTWNMVELVNLTLFLTMFGLRWKWMSNSESAQLQMPFDGSEYPDKLEDIVDDYQFQVYLNAFNTVLTMMKILKFVRLNDQLNILTKTLAAAQDSIIGVLALFVYFVFAFALTGMSLYGANLFHFRTVDAAYNTLMRMLVGDFDYAAMSEIHRPATVMFFWGFVIFANFLLLNFLIAVLSDAFQDVCDSRLPLPIDQAIVRAAQQVKEQLLPAALRVTFLLLSQRKTRTDLTAKQARLIREFRDSILSEEAKHFKDYDELEFYYLTKEYFITNVPEELQTEDNLNFMGEVWTDMAWEWHWHMMDKHAKEQHEQEELVQEVVDAEMGYFNTKGKEIYDAATKINTIAHKMKALRNGMEDKGLLDRVKAVVEEKVEEVKQVFNNVAEEATEKAQAVGGFLSNVASSVKKGVEDATAGKSEEKAEDEKKPEEEEKKPEEGGNDEEEK